MFRSFRASQFFRRGRLERRFASNASNLHSAASNTRAITYATAAAVLAGTSAALYQLYKTQNTAFAEVEAAPEIAETAAEAAFVLVGHEDAEARSFRWIDVTNDNFETVLPQFKMLLEKSVFISMDTEFSGVTVTRDQVPEFQDSPEEYYRKKASAVSNFSVLQVGICLWVPQTSGAKSSLVAYPFNFYVFPRPYLHNKASIPSDASTSFVEPSHNPVFSVQTGSLQFLAQHGFDFNTLMAKGITFMNEEKENYFRDEYQFVKPPEGLKSKRPVKVASPQDKKFVEDMINLVDEWHKACSNPDTCKPLMIHNLNSFQRLVAFTELPKRFGADTLKMKTVRTAPGSKLADFEVSLQTEEEKKAKIEGAIEKNRKYFEKALGMRRVMKQIFAGNESSVSPSRIIVGHNMLLDLMYLYNCFYKNLPMDAKDFRKGVQTIMPKIVDTKHVATTDQRLRQMLSSSTALNIVYQLAKQSKKFGGPEIRFDKSFGSSADHGGAGFLHQAAYDAYITGYSFVKFMHFKEGQTDDYGVQTPEYYEERAKDYLNQLHLMFNKNRVFKLGPEQTQQQQRQKPRRWRG